MLAVIDSTQAFMIALYVLSAFGVIALFILYKYNSKNHVVARQRKLASLSGQHERLKMVVSELLAQANDADQEGKYLGQDAQHSLRIAHACSELVAISNTLSVIDQNLKSGKVRDSRDAIIATCTMALDVSNELHTMKFLRDNSK